jgi:hypothetical protein
MKWEEGRSQKLSQQTFRLSPHPNLYMCYSLTYLNKKAHPQQKLQSIVIKLDCDKILGTRMCFECSGKDDRKMECLYQNY